MIPTILMKMISTLKNIVNREDEADAMEKTVQTMMTVTSNVLETLTHYRNEPVENITGERLLQYYTCLIYVGTLYFFSNDYRHVLLKRLQGMIHLYLKQS